MKLILKEKLISWFDSFNIYDENDNIVYKVKGELALGHQLRIYDSQDNEVGLLKEKLLTLFDQFKMYEKGKEVGEIQRKLSLINPKFELTCNDWKVTGDIFEWNYDVVDSNDQLIMQARKRLLTFTDTYEIDIKNKKDALYCLMIVLAIDASKCDDSNNID